MLLSICTIGEKIIQTMVKNVYSFLFLLHKMIGSKSGHLYIYIYKKKKKNQKKNHNDGINSKM